MANCTLVPDPGLFYPSVITGQTEKQVFPLYGQTKLAGALDHPLFPTNGIDLLFGAIGLDGGASGAPFGFGVTGSSPTLATTLNGATIAGATTIIVTSAAGYVIGDLVQVDTNVAGASSAEVRKITNIVTNTLTLDPAGPALNFDHANGVAVSKVIAPFTHQAIPGVTLPSFTLEKRVGGNQAEQYAGTRLAKWGLKMGAANTEAQVTADLIAQAIAILANPNPVSFVDEAPYVFAEATLTVFGSPVPQVGNVEMTIDTGLKETYTQAQQHNVQFLTPTARKTNGKLDVVYSSLDDATYGYLSKLGVTGVGGSAVQGALSYTLAHPASGGTVTVALPQINLSSYADEIKLDDVVMLSLGFEASLQLSSGQSVTATVINQTYLPY